MTYTSRTSPARSARLARLALLAALLATGACSSPADSGSPDAASTAGTAATSPAEAAPRAALQPLDLCALTPMADVSATLQAHGVDPVNTVDAGEGGMCSYRRELEPRGYSTKLLIDFTRFPSVEKAREATQAMREEYGRRLVTPRAVPGLGDDAMVFHHAGAASVRIQHGPLTGQINLRMGERDPAELTPAVLALAKQVAERLPRQ